MEAPAFWTVSPDADRDEVVAFIARVAEELGIPVPPLHGSMVALPSDRERVEQAMARVDPEGEKRALLSAPAPQD